jgi:hypothetical protein
MRFMDAPRMKTSTLRRFLGQEAIELHLALHQADCMGSHGKLDNLAYCRGKMAELAEADRERSLLPPPLARGDDLLAMGLRPGPLVGELLEAARERQLDGDFDGREAALAWLREEVNRRRERDAGNRSGA